MLCQKTAPIARRIARLWRGEIQFADFTSFRDIDFNSSYYHLDFNNPPEESLDDQIQGNQILVPSMMYEEI